MPRLVTFNPLRTIGIPNSQYIKPIHMFKELETIKAADFLLFPEYWQVNSLVYGLKKNIYPSLAAFHLGHNKVEMTRALMLVAPQHVPYTEILASTAENADSILGTFSFPFVAKEIKNSMGNGVFFIKNRQQFVDYAARNEVLYVQEYLQADRDLRVCVAGSEIVTAYWRISETGEFLHNIARGGSLSFEGIPEDALRLVAETAQILGINHAGFDILYADGHPYILEFNVLYGNQGIHEQGISLEDKIYQYVRAQL